MNKQNRNRLIDIKNRLMVLGVAEIRGLGEKVKVLRSIGW